MPTNEPRAYFASILYTDHDGAAHTIKALILAVSEQDAIGAAIDAVSALPNCRSVDGGMLESVDETASPRANADARGLTVPTVPPSRTVH
jgi:hypothetical protein